MMFRLALRTLLHSPGFTLSAVVTLALGIGISTAIFSFVNAVVLAPLPFPHPDRIVSVETRLREDQLPFRGVSGGDFVDLRRLNQCFDAISVYTGSEVGVQAEGSAQFTYVYWVNPEFYRVFSFKLPPATRPERGAIVSEAFARRVFGNATRAIGRTITVEKRSYQVAAVVGGPTFPDKTEIWLPASYVPTNLTRNAYNYPALARLRSGISIRQAQANLDSISSQLARAFPATNANKSFRVVALKNRVIPDDVRRPLYFLFGAVLLVLLIACANVANLILARALSRTRELAVRAAIGAGRARLMREMLVESSLIGIFGGLLGFALAVCIIRLLVHLAPANLPRLEEVRVSSPVLLFAVALGVLSALLSGVIPALQVSRVDLIKTIKRNTSRGTIGGASQRLRNALVIAEVALAFVLATGSGLLFRSFAALNEVDVGYRAANVLIMYAHAPARTLDEFVSAGRDLTHRLLPELRTIPGVTAAAVVMGLPAGDYGASGGYTVVGRHSGNAGQPISSANFAVASPGYFSAVGVPLQRGRDFNSQDRFEAPGAVIVSDSLVRRSFPGEDPLGRQLVCILDQYSQRPMTIVGIVADVRQGSPDIAPAPTLYMPIEQHPYYSAEVQIVLRTTGSPGPTNEARTVAHRIMPGMAVKFETLEQMVSGTVAAPRFRLSLVGAFAMLALLLAVAGIYAVMTQLVGQRASELGLRMALGAGRSNVLWLVLSDAAKTGTLGLISGIALSLASSRFLSALLFGVSADDARTYAFASAAVASAVLLAALVPAVRAAHTDPIIALRDL